MSEQTDHDGTTSETAPTTPSEGDSRPVRPVTPVLKDYPPEASPEPGPDTVPVMVPGEQATPGHRADVFPEDHPDAVDERR